MLALNRKIHLAANRVRNGDPSLHGLLGFDLADKTIGIIGTGQVGRRLVRILRAFGATVLAYDAMRVPEVTDMGATYVPLEHLLRSSDIISLHAPLVPATRHIIGATTLQFCRKGMHIINTARGALIDSAAVVEALRSGHIGALGIDVFEGETDVLLGQHGRRDGQRAGGAEEPPERHRHGAPGDPHDGGDRGRRGGDRAYAEPVSGGSGSA